LEFSPIHKVQPFQSLVASGVVVTALDLRSTDHMFDIRPSTLSGSDPGQVVHRQTCPCHQAV